MPIDARLQLGLEHLPGPMAQLHQAAALQGLQQENQIRGLQAQQAQKQMQAQQILDNAYKNHFKDGNLDMEGVYSELASSGQGSIIPTLKERDAKLQETLGNAQVMNAKLDEVHEQLAGEMGAHMQSILEAGGPTAAENAAGYGALRVKQLQSKGLMTGDEAAGLVSKFDPSDEQTLRTTIKAMQEPLDRRTRQAVAAKMAEPVKVGAGESLVVPSGPSGQPNVLFQGQKPFKDKAELAADAANSNSPTAAQSKAALDLLASADKDSAAKQKERYMELEAKRIQGQKLTPAEAAEHKAYERATTLGPEASARLAVLPIQTVNEQGQPITEYKTRAQALAAGPIQKPLSGVVQNRVDASKAAVATGEDIIKQLQDPKVAAQLGPAIGRFNTVREFIGNPPPELAQLAGEIESYSFAQMGVHGMRSTEGAKQIANLLDRKHTPASMISAIRGVNGFAQNYVQGATGKPITPAAAPTDGAGETPYQRYLRGGGTNR